ncbi:MAG: hypothetical protein K2H85_01905 [Allobaculum sp.]|nr:hypothetical protein [Allobaculum sp.]
METNEKRNIYDNKEINVRTVNKGLNTTRIVEENTDEKEINLYLKLHIANHRPG